MITPMLSFLVNIGFATCLQGCGAQNAVLADNGFLTPSSQSSSAAPTGSSGAAGPIRITHGGVYSGNWTSNSPQVPVVTIQTNQPVTIQNATVTGRGDLIVIEGTGAGANVTIQNVTGTALDPQVAQMQRGSFVTGSQVTALSVQHCTMTGVRFGLKLLSSTVYSLLVSQNIASGLEDRESDGQGGFLNARPDLGHFVMLNRVSAPKGADISWNQVVNTIGQNSTEDVVNIYKSQGSVVSPIAIHDNYMEGYASPGGSSYTGTGIIADGDASEPVTAYLNISANQMVHTAGSGIEVANGHNILANNNRVVSCGQDSQGNWFAAPFANAVVMWNYYSAPEFYDNNVLSTAGGLLRPTPTNAPMIADAWVRSEDVDATDSVDTSGFTDPCYIHGQVNLQAESTERTYWQHKLSAAGVILGDQHTF
jgi:hypothetical protein